MKKIENKANEAQKLRDGGREGEERRKGIEISAMIVMMVII